MNEVQISINPKMKDSTVANEVICEVAVAKFRFSSSFFKVTKHTAFHFWIQWNLNLNRPLTSETSDGAQGTFSKIRFLISGQTNEKDELCFGFVVKIYTKSLCIVGVSSILLSPSQISIW